MDVAFWYCMHHWARSCPPTNDPIEIDLRHRFIHYWVLSHPEEKTRESICSHPTLQSGGDQRHLKNENGVELPDHFYSLYCATDEKKRQTKEHFMSIDAPDLSWVLMNRWSRVCRSTENPDEVKTRHRFIIYWGLTHPNRNVVLPAMQQNRITDLICRNTTGVELNQYFNHLYSYCSQTKEEDSECIVKK